ncbi:Os09g0518400 [Oryza sativa Japonica Group]|uniref:Deoxynivalenol-UDP-glucosyltransferase n=1 Tax=Oryza sativa subsp. japonica TaxID=39947 RepID=Q0J0B5_ORYSJ|nr:Os09g0518400 [Oryza sativa Japonica Group]|eukprot:NP_001063686.2 Os09g0518400 [Oryza sativa Japonica Group]
MADSDGSVHVLLLSYPAQGHVNPLLQFGKRLAAHRRVRCTLAVTRSLLNSCCRAPPSPGGGGGVHVATYSDGCDARGYDELGDEGAYLSRLESAGSATLDELLRGESGEGRPVRAVVYDAFLPWAAPVARRHGASCAAFFTQACAVNVAYAHAWAGRVELPLPTSAPAPPLPGVPPELEPADFPTFLTAPAAGRSAYLDLLLRQCQGLEVADHVLVNSFHELQPKEAEYMAATWGAKTVGPTVPSAYLDGRLPGDASYGFDLHTPMAAESKAWLDERAASSVVYVSFGSLATPSAVQMAELAHGLRDSGRFFLWVVRSSETGKLPDGFAGETAAKNTTGLIVPWCPQLEVLAHGAVGCFVTHCGWNSTVEAVSAGVPMVAVAQWSDQPTNARYVEEAWRVGVRARADGEGVVRKEEVARCVAGVMDGETGMEFRTNAARWSAMARAAMSQGEKDLKQCLGIGSAQKNIDLPVAVRKNSAGKKDDLAVKAITKSGAETKMGVVMGTWKSEEPFAAAAALQASEKQEPHQSPIHLNQVEFSIGSGLGHNYKSVRKIRCYGTAVGTGTARYQNPGRWIWPDLTAGRVWYRAVPILSLCSTTRRTEVEGQKRNFACNNRIGRDGRAARTLEALGFLIDRRRRLLEVNSAVAAAASGKDDIDAATVAGNDKFAAAVACFNVAAATVAGKDDIDAAAAGKEDIDAAATGNDEFATAAAYFNTAAARKDEFVAAAAACFNACRNPPLAAT